MTSRGAIEALASAGIPTSPIDAEACRDFGGIVEGAPLAITRPRDGEDLVRLVSLARDEGFSLTTRGLGMSQGGQSIARGSVGVDLAGVSRVEPVRDDVEVVRCEGGATWRRVVEETSRARRLPRVLPLNLDLTVGGTLSVGGFGSTSHRFGPIVSNVVELEVVTGEGRLVRCSANEERDLFDGALAGLGRVGIIARATIRLRPIPSSVRTFFLLYDRADAWLADQRAIARARLGTHLEASCCAATLGVRREGTSRRPVVEWLHALQLSFEHDGPPPGLDALEGLRPWKVAHVDDGEPIELAARYDGRFAFMKKSGAFTALHPWVEALVPADVLPAILPRLLEAIPTWFGDGHRTFVVAGENAPRFFARPAGDAIGFAVLPAAIPPSLRDEALAALGRVHAILVEAGGKRYLSGWLGPMDEGALRAHFGDDWDAWVAVKRRFDPRGVFASPFR